MLYLLLLCGFCLWYVIIPFTWDDHNHVDHRALWYTFSCYCLGTYSMHGSYIHTLPLQYGTYSIHHSWFQVCVRGDYTLEILINSYSTPLNRAARWNGGCCDYVECDVFTRCENIFNLRAQPLPNSGHIGSAVIPSTHTGYHDREVVNLHVSSESSGQWPVRCTLGNCFMILQPGYDCTSSFIICIG